MKNIKFTCSLLALTMTLAFNYIKAQDNMGGQVNKTGNHVNTRETTPVKVFEHVIGTWKVDSIYKGKKNVSSNYKNEINSTLKFNEDGKYVRYANKQRIDSGAYRANENLSVLYLESALKKQVTEWSVLFKEHTITLQRKDSTPQVESMKYVYTRIDAK